MNRSIVAKLLFLDIFQTEYACPARRADETSASDADVLLIARDATHRELLMDRLLAGVDTLRVQYGATASPVAYTSGEARRGWGECAAPWPDIARDVVPILGPPLSELLT